MLARLHLYGVHCNKQLVGWQKVTQLCWDINVNTAQERVHNCCTGAYMDMCVCAYVTWDTFEHNRYEYKCPLKSWEITDYSRKPTRGHCNTSGVMRGDPWPDQTAENWGGLPPCSRNMKTLSNISTVQRRESDEEEYSSSVHHRYLCCQNVVAYMSYTAAVMMWFPPCKTFTMAQWQMYQSTRA